MAQAYAALREAAGQGETDAFAASEFPVGRAYDRVVAITRSGTTTEVLELLGAVRGRTATTALTADPETPVMKAADEVVVLDWADEESVVQTRFATTALALLRAGLEAHGPLPAGVATVAEAAADAETALRRPLPEAPLAATQWTFLGRGWTYGLAQEAALKMREAAGAWTESYPAMEYRHGPLAITAPTRVTWIFGPVPAGLADDVARAGGTLVADAAGAGAETDGDPAEGPEPTEGAEPAEGTRPTERAEPTQADRPGKGLDPMADLIRAQRLAVAVAEARGCDPDRPRNLTRSVILTD
ncbi:sugar isomerase [Streptomyces sp. LX-29]|uniref:SIS domain-containing protein n=1 Tax=Streptomyces sp. LX-29 TaxID=2900152 RepID=UPI00240E0E99|nr:sugar isomerase [Streptomyces sp. LX-29]WFB11712.1 sugar isomerase [Streptomyces sp. LX-29]